METSAFDQKLRAPSKLYGSDATSQVTMVTKCLYVSLSVRNHKQLLHLPTAPALARWLLQVVHAVNISTKAPCVQRLAVPSPRAKPCDNVTVAKQGAHPEEMFKRIMRLQVIASSHHCKTKTEELQATWREAHQRRPSHAVLTTGTNNHVAW